MKPCDHLPQYLDGRLERAGREYFESHLGICSDCRKLINIWACTKNVLRNEAKERQKYLTPTDEEASRLVQRAALDASSRGFFSVRVLVPLTACVSFALAFVLASQLNDRGALSESADRNSHPVATVGPVVPENVSVPNQPALEYETKQDGRTTGRFGNDRFGLAAMSKLKVISTESKTTLLRLEHGVAAFSVSKRKGGREFVVEAGDYRVVVVGTRFTVDRSDGSGIRVSVAEGIVKVLENGGREWRLTAGEALSVALDGTADRTITDKEEIEETARLLGEIELDASHTAALVPALENETMLFEQPRKRGGGTGVERRRYAEKHESKNQETLSLKEAANPEEETSATPEAETASPEKEAESLSLSDEADSKGVNLWRQWVLEGRFEAAEAALMEYLIEHPVDAEAYSLLADCRRKAGKYAEAVETYKKLTAIAGDYQANRARFKAGVLMQENLKNHLGAAAIFDEYLSTGKGTPLLRAKAAIRLAASLIELGETKRAKQLLRRIADDYSGSSVAIQAREMLGKID